MLDKFPEDVKIVHKNFPLSSHKYALKAAMAAMAANKQGKFLEFNTALFKDYKSLNDQKINAIAEGLNLDMEAFAKDMNSMEFRKLIDRDMKDGRKLGIRGIPTVFVNGKMLKVRSMEGFVDLVKAELK